MATLDGSLIDGPRRAPAAGGAPAALVVLLHGYGSNGLDLIAFAPALAAALPSAAFVAPDAPQPCPGVPGGRQWWPLTSFSRASLAAGARAAAPGLDAFLDAELAAAGLPPGRLLLVGFSQGTMLALHVGLRRPAALAGVIGYAGLLADPAPPPPASCPPVLLVHGDADPLVPVAGSREAAAVLAGQGVAVDLEVEPGLGHGVGPAGLAAGIAFARRVLA